MRTVDIPIRGTQRLQVFARPRSRGVREVGIVTVAAGRRMVYDHYLTSDDLERRLCYSRPKDLVWRDAAPADIPSRVGRPFAGEGQD